MLNIILFFTVLVNDRIISTSIVVNYISLIIYKLQILSIISSNRNEIGIYMRIKWDTIISTYIAVSYISLIIYKL